MKFTRRPATVEAVQVQPPLVDGKATLENVKEINDLFGDAVYQDRQKHHCFIVNEGAGPNMAHPGDWIVKREDGFPKVFTDLEFTKLYATDSEADDAALDRLEVATANDTLIDPNASPATGEEVLTHG